MPDECHSMLNVALKSTLHLKIMEYLTNEKWKQNQPICEIYVRKAIVIVKQIENYRARAKIEIYSDILHT